MPAPLPGLPTSARSEVQTARTTAQKGPEWVLRGAQSTAGWAMGLGVTFQDPSHPGTRSGES